MIAGRLISWAAAQHGERPSLVLRDRSVSHREVEARSNRFAQAADRARPAAGRAIRRAAGELVESLDSLFGAEKAALTYVALNARHTLAEHLEILADAQASAVLVGPQFAELASALAAASGRDLPLRHVLALPRRALAWWTSVPPARPHPTGHRRGSSALTTWCA
jgi:long-chain acyl-CoA synthetase